jgi:cation diffusion facilitator family transporter
MLKVKDERTKSAIKITWVGFLANVALSVFKLIAGIVGNSTAMVADAIHSISDFITDIIVIVFVGVSGKERDSDHKYGHGKFETFASFLVSIALIVVGIFIFWNGLMKIIDIAKGNIIEPPTLIALIAAIVSIITKEAIYQYTVKTGKKINNNAVIANAWHHRSDALSSLGTGIGIGGAMFLGPQARILDPIAGIIVSFFIIQVAFKILLPSVNELLERSLPKDIEKEIIDTINSIPQIRAFHNLKTRKVGNTYVIDVHIKLDKEISFTLSHDIATQLENKLRENYGSQTIISVHTEPYYERANESTV